jgi:hypothetical protein
MRSRIAQMRTERDLGPFAVRRIVDTGDMVRSREQELEDSLAGCTVEEVRVLDTTGGPLAVVRLSRPDADDTFACFDASTFADADSIWHQMTSP